IFELVAAPLTHCLLQCRIAIVGEEEKRILLVIFLAHENERRMWREQQESCGHHAYTAVDQNRPALAQRAIADQIVVLQVDHMRGTGYIARGCPARAASPVLKRLALKSKTFIESAHDLSRTIEVLIEAGALAGKKGVDRMMKIVAPQAFQPVASLVARA